MRVFKLGRFFLPRPVDALQAEWQEWASKKGDWLPEKPDAAVCHCEGGRISVYLRDVERGQTSRVRMVGVDL
jgi:hypothetical protein